MGSWVDDETINAHVALLAPYLPADVVVVDSYFVGQSGKPGVRAKFLRNGFLSGSSEIKRLIAPVHDVNHWFVVEMDVRSREIRFYDSLTPGKKRKRKCFDVLVDFLEVFAPQSEAKKKWKHVEVGGLSEQQNATECGVYTIARIKAIVLGWERPEALICDKNMVALRKLFVKELKAKKSSSNRPKLK
jgi:Ulp1 family protease